MSRRSNTARSVQRRRNYIGSVSRRVAARMWRRVIGTSRVLLPGARGVYHPQPTSRVILGVALPAGCDADAIGRELWWRGLGLIERDGRLIAGADIDAAVAQRRVRQARAFVTRQLRDAGVRGAVRRWEGR